MQAPGLTITFSVSDPCGNMTTCTTLIPCTSELPPDGDICTFTPGYWANHNDDPRKAPDVVSTLEKMGVTSIPLGPWLIDAACIDVLLPGPPDAKKNDNLKKCAPDKDGNYIQYKDINAMTNHIIALTLNIGNSKDEILGNIPLALLAELRCEMLNPDILPDGATVNDLLAYAQTFVPGFNSEVTEALTAINECINVCEAVREDNPKQKEQGNNQSYAVAGKASPQLTLMPNPVSDQLRVQFVTGEAGIAIIDVFNTQGVRIKTLKLESYRGQNEVMLETGDMAPGSYYLVLQTGSAREYKPFIRVER